jgi:CitMHS family citrate-Mg2+:H+ or citrate-Ca2+:H+ symporter
VLHEPVAAAFDAIARPGWRLAANWGLTILLIGALVAQLLPLPLLFMIGAALALVLNFPSPSAQSACIGRHAPAILAVAGLIFAAAVFTGVLSGSGMSEAIAQGVVGAIPPALGPYMAVVTALVSIPMTWMVSNDAFYFGMLPILASAAAEYGISPAEMARAALVGQPVHILSPLVASTYLLVGMLGIDYGDNQRATLKYSALNALVLLAACLLFGAAPLTGAVAR